MFGIIFYEATTLLCVELYTYGLIYADEGLKYCLFFILKV